MLSSGLIFSQRTFDYILKAQAFVYNGQPDQAITLLTGAITEINESALYIERAEAYIIKGDYTGAIRDYNEANKINPLSGEYGLSRIYALKGDATTALYHLGMNLNSSFRKSEKEIMLDPAFRPIENRPEWRQFWKKEWYSLIERGISEIEYYVSAGKIEESKAVISELKQSYGRNNEILYAEALINLSSGKVTEATKVISGLIVLDPSNEKYLRILAKSQMAANNPVGASDTYTKILDLGIPDPKLLKLRSDCYRKTGEYGKALADIKRFLDIFPEDKEALSLAGKVEAVSGDNLKALEYFSKNLELHPNDAECYIDRANSYFISNSWDWAIKDYSMALDLNPESSDVWLNKGIALLKSGRVGDACHDFRKSFSMSNKRASEYISKHCIK